MKIALIGYGRMGRMIERIAKERGNEIVAVIDVENPQDFDSEAFKSADVAIEFTIPSQGFENILKCFERAVPVVSGTTGFGDRIPMLREMCEKGEGTLLHSTNFSIGVNIFRAVNRYLSKIMSDFPAYRPFMSETHHIHKLDHPSGTAHTLADELVGSNDNVEGWFDPTAEHKPETFMPVNSIREGEVPGIHSIKWDSEVDSITITHSAKSRAGFALGAVRAAEWLAGKKGFFTMSEMLSDITHTTNLFT